MLNKQLTFPKDTSNTDIYLQVVAMLDVLLENKMKPEATNQWGRVTASKTKKSINIKIVVD